MKVPPLSPDIEQLLEVERDIPPVSGEQSARMLAAVQATVAGGPAGPGDGGAAGPGGATSASGLASAGVTATSGLGRLITVAAVAFAAGGGVGAGVYHLVAGGGEAPLDARAPSAPIAAALADGSPSPLDGGAPILASPDADADTTPAEDGSLGDGDVVVRPAPPSRPHGTRPRPGASDGDGGAVDASPADGRSRERQILEIARAAVARGNAAEALAAVRRHAELYPRGRLVEEREALRILALARAGRRAEATRRATTFRQRFPGSVFGPAIDQAVPPSAP